jgi:hypothetical protein
MGLMDDVKSKKKQKEAENWFNMGVKSQDPEKKLDYFTRSLELEPNNVSAWLKKGRIFEDLGKFDEAKKCYDRATLLDPSLDIRVKKTNSAPEENMVIVPDTVKEEKQYVQEKIQYTQDDEEHFPVTSAAETDSYEVEETEETVSFTPPQGEESLFSNIRKNEASIAEEEKEIILTDLESVKSSGVISFSHPDPEIVPDNNVSGQNVPERINDTVAATPLSGPTSDNAIKREITPTFDKKPTAGNTPGIGKETKQIQPEKTGISSYVDMEGKNANLRIPLSETIKFWLVGAIVLLALYMIIRLIS